METGIGQGKTLVSPLHMLLVTSAVANKGMVMKPYLTDHIENAAGDTISSSEPAEDETNAWFTGFAKKKGYRNIAVAVIVEKSGAGSTYAVPVAKKIFDVYFNR